MNFILALLIMMCVYIIYCVLLEINKWYLLQIVKIKNVSSIMKGVFMMESHYIITYQGKEYKVDNTTKLEKILQRNRHYDSLKLHKVGGTSTFKDGLNWLYLITYIGENFLDSETNLSKDNEIKIKKVK